MHFSFPRTVQLLILYYPKRFEGSFILPNQLHWKSGATGQNWFKPVLAGSIRIVDVRKLLPYQKRTSDSLEVSFLISTCTLFLFVWTRNKVLQYICKIKVVWLLLNNDLKQRWWLAPLIRWEMSDDWLCISNAF